MKRTLGILLTVGVVATSLHGQCISDDRLEDTPVYNGEFGAAVEVEGNYAFVGSPGEGTGVVDIFRIDNGSWVWVTQLAPTNGATGDRFGASLAADGDTLVVGAPQSDSNGTWGGKVYVYRDGTFGWYEDDILSAPDAAAWDRFGYSVAISGDRIVVGAPFNATTGTLNGAAYLFEDGRRRWDYVHTFESDIVWDGAYFGMSVAIGPRWVAAGEYTLREVDLFEEVSGSWTHSTSLQRTESSFGWSLALDGDYLAVGSPYDHASNTEDGSVVVFEWDGASWTQFDKVSPEPADPYCRFGWTIDLDDGVLAVGGTGYQYQGEITGAGYAYRFGGGGLSTAYTLVAQGSVYWDGYGTGIGTYQGRVVVGGPGAADSGGNDDTGAAISFDLSRLSLSTSIPDPGPGDSFDIVTNCGPQGTPCLLYAMDVDDVYLGWRLITIPFDGNAEARIHVNGAPNLGGAVVTLQSFGLNILGQVVESNSLDLKL